MPDIVSIVQTELNETGAGIFWPVQQVYDAINDAQLEQESIAYLPMVTTTLTITASADLMAWPNTVMMWPHYIEYNGRKLWVIKHADLERYDRNWRSTTPDQPRFFVLWDETRLRPYPLADVNYVMNVWGPGWGTEIGISGTTTTTDFVVPALLKHAIGMRASARLFASNRPDLSQVHFKEAEEYEARYRMQWRRQQGDNIKRLRPGTAFTHSQGGNIRIAKRISGNPNNPYR
jgi:hypothetical protein